jgi:hypothetical protein
MPLRTPGGVAAAAAVAQPLLLWDHDFKAMGDTDWYGVSSATLSTLPVTLTDTGGGAFVWGPDSGTGVEVQTAGKWGRIRVNWSDISALMDRTLESTDTLAFVCQNAAISSIPASQNSNVQMEFANGNDVALGALRKNGSGVGDQNLAIGLWNGAALAWEPGLYGGGLSGLRTCTALMSQDRVHFYASDQTVTTDEPPYGTGPYIVRPYYAPAIIDATAAVATQSKVWDFSVAASYMWWMIQPIAGETVPMRLEHAQIWLIPGTPNE